MSKIRLNPFNSPPDQWARAGGSGGGRAAIGALLLAAAERGIDLFTETPARELVMEDGRVAGVRAEREGRDFFVRASRGVLLATGGFEWSGDLNRQHVYGPPVHPVTPPSNEGDGHVMAMEVGADTALMDYAIWLPAVAIPGDDNDGEQLYRHLVPRPGAIIVNREGRRFANESLYWDVRRGGVVYDAVNQTYPNIPMYLILDQRCRDRYELATLAPGTEAPPWLVRAPTLPELGAALDIAPDALEEAVRRFNQYASEGGDPDFGRGTGNTRMGGDPENKPNPCLAPLSTPPFYGVELVPCTLGNLGGLVTNATSQVLDVRGRTIPGLYACGNTAAQLAFGMGYNSGASNGQSFVFGYVAGRHAANAPS